MRRVCIPEFLFLFTLLTFSLYFGVDQESLKAPKIKIETIGEFIQVWVDVELPDEPLQSHLLRSTTQSVSQELSGLDPTGQAYFAAWTEGNGQRWFSLSRDSGRNWSEAKPLKIDLLLHDGARYPEEPMPSAPSEFELPSDGRLFIV